MSALAIQISLGLHTLIVSLISFVKLPFLHLHRFLSLPEVLENSYKYILSFFFPYLPIIFMHSCSLYHVEHIHIIYTHTAYLYMYWVIQNILIEVTVFSDDGDYCAFYTFPSAFLCSLHLSWCSHCEVVCSECSSSFPSANNTLSLEEFRGGSTADSGESPVDSGESPESVWISSKLPM